MNTNTAVKHFTHAQIRPLLSDYLQHGRKTEAWQIDDVVIQGDTLKASISMTSFYQSSFDDNRFHLTIFSTLEFLSQLMIVYAHEWAGIDKKVREGWMVDSKTRCVRAIRSPEHIRVNMQVKKMYQRGVNLYCVADYTVTDHQDGLFEVTLKGFLS